MAQLNGVDFVPVPGTLAVYGRLGVRSVAPLTGPRAGGTVLELRGLGLRASPELSVLFVRGGRRAARWQKWRGHWATPLASSGAGSLAPC